MTTASPPPVKPTEAPRAEEALRVEWYNPHRHAVILADDTNTILTHAGEILRAISNQRVRDREEGQFLNAFQKTLKLITDWVVEFKPKLRSAHLTRQGSRFLFIAETLEVEFDDELSKAIVNLDLVIARDPAISKSFRLDALAIPHYDQSNLRTFLDPDFSLRCGLLDDQ